MKLIIILLVIACLIQTSFLPINLVLILLICRSLARQDKLNYFLAFFSGILLGILTPTNIGFYSLTFLLAVFISEILHQTPISSNIFTVIPVTFILTLVIGGLEMLFLGQSLNLVTAILGSLIALPIYIGVKFWEERFIVTPHMKLKL
jgi:rod shape-determining protein MreD